MADLRERTLREARATARLSHPNVITTYDVVEEDGRPWIVMELLATRSLSEVLRDDGPLPPHRVAEIGLGVLSALETSHAQGIVHRDVKPSNVLITDDGRPVLTDFGIATMAGDPALTSTGVVLGSPAYMSPERARGKAFGPESDLWSLGATLYVRGRRSPAVRVGQRPGHPDRRSSPTRCRRCRWAVRWRSPSTACCAKDPQDRAGFGETRELLTRAAADHTAGAAAPTVGHRRPGPGRPHRGAAGSGRRAAVRPGRPAAAATTTYDERAAAAAAACSLPPSWSPCCVIGGLVAFALNSGDDPDQQADDKPSASSRHHRRARLLLRPARPPSSTAPPADDGVPAGFQLYEDPSGFSVAVPEGWRRAVQRRPRSTSRDPDGSSFLRIDQTDEPKDDPKKDWEQQEKSVQEGAAELPADQHRVGRLQRLAERPTGSSPSATNRPTC